MDKQTTSRRSFLKAGAIVAAPVAAAAVPAAAMAGDGSGARLARLEDERAIEALQRKFVRYLNGNDANGGDCGAFVAPADAVDLGEGLRAIAEDTAHDAEVVLSDDGRTATARCACRVERETEFAGESTLEQMARFQGHGSHRHEERQVLATSYVKGKDGWRIASARFA